MFLYLSKYGKIAFSKRVESWKRWGEKMKRQNTRTSNFLDFENMLLESLLTRPFFD
jgi:hypothetical protein